MVGGSSVDVKARTVTMAKAEQTAATRHKRAPMAAALGAGSGAVFALVMTLFVVASPGEAAAGARSTPLSFFAVWAICLVIALVLAVVGLRIRVAAPAEPVHDMSDRPAAEPIEER